MTRQLFLAFTLGLLTCLPVQAQTTASDDAAIKDVVRRYADAREARDPEAVAALFTEDADQLVSSGEWRRGRDAVVKGTLASSAASSGSRSIAIETVRLIGPDLALAEARAHLRDEGVGRHAREARSPAPRSRPRPRGRP